MKIKNYFKLYTMRDFFLNNFFFNYIYRHYRRILDGSILLKWQRWWASVPRSHQPVQSLVFFFGYRWMFCLRCSFLGRFRYGSMKFLFLVRSFSCHQCPTFFAIRHWFIIRAKLKKSVLTWHSCLLWFQWLALDSTSLCP